MYGNVVVGDARASASSRRSRRPSSARGVEARHRARRGGAARADAAVQGLLRVSRRTPPTSSAARSGRCSTPGRASGPSPTGASTGSRTSGAPRSTSSRWCSATWARRSGSGVAFSRDELTGAPQPSGDFLANAQGEDVVSGVRTPRDISELRDWLPEVHAQLLEILTLLERHYGDMQDTEFTVQEGRLLHAADAQREAPRAGRGALRGRRRRRGPARPRARDRDDRSRGARRAAASDLRPRRRLRGDRARRRRLAGRGQGRDRADRRGGRARRRGRTRGDPRAGLHRGRRRRRLPCRARDPHERGRQGQPCGARRARHGPPGGDRRRRRAGRRSPRGSCGSAAASCAPASGSRSTAATARSPPTTCRSSSPRSPSTCRPCSSWCDELRTLGVRANADTPEDARRAIELGAEGIGLCRTEHMFLGERQPLMADVIMAGDEHERGRARSTACVRFRKPTSSRSCRRSTAGR